MRTPASTGGRLPIAALIRRIDLTTLQLFVAVCEEGKLTKASQRQAIAPSAASKRLHDLEETFHISLFERLPTGMVLTAAGETLLHHARIMLLNMEQIATELFEYSEGVRGHIRMLANLSAIVEFLPDDLPPFFREHTSLRFDLQERSSAGVVLGIEEGAAEIGICSGDVETRSLQRFRYRGDRLVVVVPDAHPLTSRSAIDFAETLDYDHVGLFASSSIYLRSQYSAQQVGRSIRLRVHVPGFDAACRMVQAGMGVGLLPDRAVQVLGAGMGLVAVPLRDEWAARELSVVVRDASALSTTSRLMFEHLMRGVDLPARGA